MKKVTNLVADSYSMDLSLSLNDIVFSTLIFKDVDEGIRKNTRKVNPVYVMGDFL